MADSNHTKGPLQVLITDGETMKDANCVLISENGDQIARCSAPFPFDTSWDERDANAHRLALAWNCHDELLAAMKIAQQFMSIASDWNLDEAEIDGEMRSTYDWLEIVNAALAKALPSAAKKD